MIRCNCKRGFLLKDGNTYECTECSAIYKFENGKLVCIPALPITPSELNCEQRKEWFFDRLVKGQGPKQIVEDLVVEGKVRKGGLFPSEVKSYRENHYCQILAARLVEA